MIPKKEATQIMKISLLVVSFVLLVGSIVGVSKAFALPTEIEEQVTLLEYQHEGTFDYLVYLKSSYLYGTSQPPQTISQFPIKLIDSFEMSFIYQSAEQVSQEVEVNAVLENAGVWQKTIVLVPKTSKRGDFSLSFPIDLQYFQELGQTINEEIGISASSHDITIKASIYSGEADFGQVSEGFSQALCIKLSKSFIEISEDLIRRHGDSVGKFDYTVHLKPNTLFDATTLKPPSVTSTPKTMGPGDTIFSKLVDGMNVSFSYHLEASKPIRQLEEEVEIEATIEDPGKWSKTIVLVPVTKKSGDFTTTFPLDLDRFTEISDTVQQETGVSASAYNLTIKANVHVTGQTDFGTIDEDFTQSMKTDLREGILAWDGDLEKSQSGSIQTTEIIRNQEKYLGLPVTGVRILSSTVTGIIFILFVFSLLIYFRPELERPTEIERKAQRAGKKYKDIIVEIKELPGVKPGETVISLDSLDDLVKAAQGLLKPVLHKAEKERHTYCVLDASTRYEYLLAEEPPSTEKDTPTKAT